MRSLAACVRVHFTTAAATADASATVTTPLQATVRTLVRCAHCCAGLPIRRRRIGLARTRAASGLSAAPMRQPCGRQRAGNAAVELCCGAAAAAAVQRARENALSLPCPLRADLFSRSLARLLATLLHRPRAAPASASPHSSAPRTRPAPATLVRERRLNSSHAFAHTRPRATQAPAGRPLRRAPEAASPASALNKLARLLALALAYIRCHFNWARRHDNCAHGEIPRFLPLSRPSSAALTSSSLKLGEPLQMRLRKNG